MQPTELISLHDVAKSFRASDGSRRNVLEKVNFTMQEGEIVALLGKSGSGKSTLLRIIAGLINADQGQMQYRSQPIMARWPASKWYSSLSRCFRGSPCSRTSNSGWKRKVFRPKRVHNALTPCSI